MLFYKFKLSHHRHSGKYLPHHHTSYHGLVLISFLVAAFMVVVGSLAKAAEVTVSALVPNDPPSQAAVILKPTGGQHVSQNPIQVEGTCQASNPAHIIKLYSNGVFVGSAICTGSGTFSLQANFTLGKNTLIAKSFNFIDQPGPDSDMVEFFLDDSKPINNVVSQEPVSVTTAQENQIVLVTNFVRFSPNQAFELSLRIGNKVPYAVNIDWGDKKEDLIVLTEARLMVFSHTYTKSGTYVIQIRGSDTNGIQDYLELVATSTPTQAIITGSVKDRGFNFEKYTGVLLIAHLTLTALIISFWLGERYELISLSKKSKQLTS